MQQKRYKPEKDRYTKARGGSSKLLSIFCAQCHNEVLLYQKDGPGSLIRMYTDKIRAPEELVEKVNGFEKKSDMTPLECFKCNALLGTPMVYDREDRLAFRVVNGAIRKVENNKGIFPQGA
jgi:hypothetical protein